MSDLALHVVSETNTTITLGWAPPVGCRGFVFAVADLDLTERLDPDDHLWFSRPGGGSVIERSRPVGEATFATWWKRALERVGVDYRNPHMARHTYATLARRQGVPVDELQLVLGHASPATTSMIYVHTRIADIAPRIRAIELFETETI